MLEKPIGYMVLLAEFGCQQLSNGWRVMLPRRRITWKGLAKTYSHYGTNGYYRKLMREVGLKTYKGACYCHLVWQADLEVTNQMIDNVF